MLQRSLFAAGLLSALLLPLRVFAFDPNYLISDRDFQNSEALNLGQIQKILERGALGTMRIQDWEGVRRSAAEIVYRAAQQHGVNPGVLLVMLQKEQSLIEETDPTQKQLDWAMGYAVCDDCAMDDPSIQRWKGFGKQVNSAAMQLTDGYLKDIERAGMTAGKYGPGITVTISGEQVTPQNAATAALYAYTPHLHGNQLFVRLYEAWFGKKFPDGSLVQVPGEDGVWLLRDGMRRPITSRSTLVSRFPNTPVLPITETILNNYDPGEAITLPNYTIAKLQNGNIYLLVDDTKRHISTMAVFRSLGFSEDEIVEVVPEDLAGYTDGPELTLASTYPQGQLIQLTTNGAVFFVQDGTRHPILDRSLLTARFGEHPSITPMAPIEVEQFREGKALGLPDGFLAKSPDSPTVYVISNGERLPIPTEEIFLGYGYSWTNIVTVPMSILKLHPEGAPLEGMGENL